MTVPQLAVIVEGHGEEYAAPQLLRRLLVREGLAGTVMRPHRIPKSRMRTELGRATQLHSARVGPAGGILVLLDADDDEPARLTSDLTGTVAMHARPRSRVCVAVREYEAWFLAGIESLRGHRSMRDDAAFDTDPEKPRDAKGRLAAQMQEPYQETLHQAAFSALVDLDQVTRRSPSFRALVDAVTQLLPRA